MLYRLGGATNRVHTEDVAIECFKLFPDSFSWVKHPEHPDKDVVRLALTDSRKERYGGLVEGRAGRNLGMSATTGRKPSEDGWILTTKGIKWVRENLENIEHSLKIRSPKEHRQKVLQQLRRIKEHQLFYQYSDSPTRFQPMIGHIADMLRCRVDAEVEIWQDRFEKVRRQAESANQKDVLDFIDKCKKAYLEQR